MDSEELAWRIRKDAIEMVHAHRASHIAAALSSADIIAVLYADIMKVDPNRPRMEERDRLILSKGHAGVSVYAALAEVGFFPREELEAYYTDGGIYSGHVSHKGIPGVELSTGSLGHGICVGAGMAFAGKRDKQPYRVFAIVGDGECNEGSVWEAAQFCRHYGLDNFVVIVDYNGLQGMGECSAVMNPLNLAQKWRAFGWNVIDVADGNNHEQLRDALAAHVDGLPTCIVAHTIKGKGISFMENKLLWHYRDPQGDDFENAMRELEDARP